MIGEQRWTGEKAYDWYNKQPWLVGCTYIPSTAVNQLEMWQEDTFDLRIIDRELSWATDLGLNCLRVYLHDLLWEMDREGFKKRIDQFLSVASGKGLKTMLVIFDDCWNGNPCPGKQPDPIPGLHNSGWLQSPSLRIVNDPTAWPRLESYVNDIISTFSHDDRVFMWDLYNEPGNSGNGSKSLGLLKAIFQWSREASPLQPLTSATYWRYPELEPLVEVQLNESDIITFHKYDTVENTVKDIQELKALGRPVICTEFLARSRGSRFETHLPVFKQERVGCIFWGLVSGKTQTIYPWLSMPGTPEPELWFHDVFHEDGLPYRQDEIAFIKEILGA